MLDKNIIYWTIKEAEEDFLGLLAANSQMILSDSEQIRFSQMRIEKRRREWLLGRVTIKSLLASMEERFNGIELPNLTIDNQPEGAPYIANFATAGNISISHRERLAVAAYTANMAIKPGIDLEKIEIRQMSFVEDFFTAAEANFTKSLEAEAQMIWVTLVWSGKEAILKAWEKGLRLDTRSLEIHPVPPGSLLAQHEGWQELAWHPRIPGFPSCWLGWRKWRDFIITLAFTLDNTDQKPEIRQIDIGSFPTLN